MHTVKKILFILLFTISLWSQEYNIRLYTIEDGLPSNEIYNITQDTSGQLWFATRKGLCKYDGFHWQIDSSISKNGAFYPVFLDSDNSNRLWSSGLRLSWGIYHLDENHWQATFLPKSIHTPSDIKDFKVKGTNDDNLFILIMLKNRIVYFFKNRWAVLNASDLSSKTTKFLGVKEDQKQFLILTNNGLFAFDGKNHQKISLPSLFQKEKIRAFQISYSDQDGAKTKNYLFLTSQNIYKYRKSAIIKKIPLSQEVRDIVNGSSVHLIDDGFGGVFLGNTFRLFHFNNYLKKWEVIKYHPMAKDLDAINFFMDQEKNLWITSYMGLFKIPTLRFLNFNEHHGLLETEVSSINQFARGPMIFGHDNGFTLYNGKTFKSVLIGNLLAPNERSNKRFMDLLPLGNDTIIAAAQQLGLVKIHRSGTYEMILPPPGRSINTIVRLSGNQFLVGTYHGLFKYSANRFAPYLQNYTKNLIIRRIMALPDRTLLLGTISHGVVVITPDKKVFDVWNKKYPNSKSVYDIKYSQHSKILVATRAGLFEFKQNNLYPVHQKVMKFEVYAILTDSENRVWLGTDRGVQIIDSSKNVTHYDYFNGLAGQECNRDALFQNSEGQIWIGTRNGLSLYQPIYDFKVGPPHIRFLDFFSDDKGDGDLVINFLCISFKDERNIALRYRLKGYHEWQYIPRLFNPMISFLNIPPGNYQFEIQARNVEGTWSPVQRSKLIQIPVPFFDSWYFKFLSGVLILLLLYSVLFAHMKGRLATKLEEEIKARTKALKESEEKYRRLFTDSQDGIFVSTVDGRPLDINEAGIKILGYESKEEVLNLRIKEDIYAVPEERDKLINLLKTRGYVRNFPLKLKRKDGEIIDTAISSTPIYDENGNIVAISGFIRDMTKWNAMKEQLAHSQRMESLGMLAGGVAHDFNNILAGILGYASLMKMKMEPDDPLFRYVDIIEKSAQRAAGLTQQLLIFSRKGQPKLQAVNINNCVIESIKLIKSTFPKTIEIETDLDKNLPEIMADPTQLSQMIINLCVNARDAMPDGEGKIFFRTKEIIIEKPEQYNNNPEVREGRFVQLTVADTGCGIPDEIKNKIFEPFFTTKPRGKGTGMGLAMVYGFIRNLGGFIELQSKLNQGTTFLMYFPVQSIHHEEQKLNNTAMIQTGQERILVVDDEEMVRSFCKMALEKFGYTIELASNGKEALERLNIGSHDFDLIILDMIMPVMDGIKAYQKIRERNKTTKILISSGYSDTDKLEKIMNDDEAVDIIFKPYKVNELLNKVRNLLDQN